MSLKVKIPRQNLSVSELFLGSLFDLKYDMHNPSPILEMMIKYWPHFTGRSILGIHEVIPRASLHQGSDTGSVALDLKDRNSAST